MLKVTGPNRRGWSAMLGGLALGAVLAIAYFRLVDIEDSWMALAPMAIAVLLAGIPYRQGPGRVGPLAPSL